MDKSQLDEIREKYRSKMIAGESTAELLKLYNFNALSQEDQEYIQSSDPFISSMQGIVIIAVIVILVILGVVMFNAEFFGGTVLGSNQSDDSFNTNATNVVLGATVLTIDSRTILKQRDSIKLLM